MPIQTRIYWLVLMLSDIMAKPVEFVLNLKEYRAILTTAVEELISCTEVWCDVMATQTEHSMEEEALIAAFKSIRGVVKIVSEAPSYREQIYALHDVVNAKCLGVMRKLKWNDSKHFAVLARRSPRPDQAPYVSKVNQFVLTPVHAFGLELSDGPEIYEEETNRLIETLNTESPFMEMVELSEIALRLDSLTPVDVAIYHQSIHATELLWESFKDDYAFRYPVKEIDYLHLGNSKK